MCAHLSIAMENIVQKLGMRSSHIVERIVIVKGKAVYDFEKLFS